MRDTSSNHHNFKLSTVKKLWRPAKKIIIYIIILYAIFAYLTFIGVSLDVKRVLPDISSSISQLEQFSILPSRNETQIEENVLKLTNELRESVGVSPLIYNKQLSILGKEHSEDMQKRGYFSHDTPEGLTPTDRAIKNGINVVKDFGSFYQEGIGENIMDMPITFIPLLIRVEGCFIVLTNDQIAQCSVEGWKNSPGHYSNMINPSYTELGVGVYCNFFGCKLTQEFI